jgi:hypothetical protein
LAPARGRHPVLAAVSRGCPRARGRFPRVTHPSATERRAEARRPVRLACVRRAASVRSEPGSNSQFDLPPPQVAPDEAGVRLHGITAQGRPQAPPTGGCPQGPRTRRVAPAGALKGDSIEPRAAPPVAAAPHRTFARSDPAHAKAPPRAARPPPFRCLSRDPKAAAHASLPLLHLVQRPTRHPPLRQVALLCRQTPRYSRNGSGQQAPFCRASQY